MYLDIHKRFCKDCGTMLRVTNVNQRLLCKNCNVYVRGEVQMINDKIVPKSMAIETLASIIEQHLRSEYQTTGKLDLGWLYNYTRLMNYIRYGVELK